MLSGIIWNGTGIVCLVILLKGFLTVWRALRGGGVKKTFATLAIGIIAGILGVVLASIAFIYTDGFIEIQPMDQFLFSIRSTAIALYILLGGYGAGIAAEKLLHTVCRKKATTTLAVMTSALLTAQPVFYGWIMVAASALE